MNRALAIFGALAGGLLFATMVKLMWDMTAHMGRMTDAVGAMSEQVGAMASDLHAMRTELDGLGAEVRGINRSVGAMEALTEDVHGMRLAVERMSGIIYDGGKQIENLNPAGIMQQMMRPPGGR